MNAGVAECTLATDCVVIPKGCCAPCRATSDVLRDRVRAVPRTRRDVEVEQECPGGAACAPCAPALYDPLAPVMRAACEDKRCVVVDVRAQAAARCDTDADCKPAETGCCGSCGGDPSGWLGLRVGESDPLAPLCIPVPPCAPCTEVGMPEAYCAADQRCAVRARATVGGQPSSTCFSSTRHPEQASSGAVGCDCYERGAAGCAVAEDGTRVALACTEQGTWTTANAMLCSP